MTESRSFIGNYLKIEMCDDLASTRESLPRLNQPYIERVRSEFAEILRTRSISMREYGELTYINFATVDDMYGYLQRVYDYLFEGAGEEPFPPTD